MIPVPGWLQPLAQSRLLEEARANLRHALRNKLGAVRNAVFYIRKKVEKTSLPTEEPRVARFFDLIEGELDQATQLVDYRPASEGAPSELDARALIERLLASLELPADRAVVLEPGGACPVRAGAEELGLAVFQLVANALDAGARRAAIRASRAGDVTTVEVEDDGDGFGPEVVSRAFDPFFTTRPGHLGVGLTIARRLVLGWGGTIELGPAPGRGARVVVRIPHGERGGPA